jgi:hypothetical protein
VTFETDPQPLSTLIPTCLARAYCTRLSTTSDPAEISMTTDFMPDSDSLLITIGGLGLFFDPGGLPLGFFEFEIIIISSVLLGDPLPPSNSMLLR